MAGANGLMQQASELLGGHRESMETRLTMLLGAVLLELRKISAGTNPTIGRRWGVRPFFATTSPSAIYETTVAEMLNLQTIWIQFKHEKEKEPLPAFILQVNGIPVFALAPGRILEPNEWGYAAETFGGDLIVPRGSVLEIVPAATGKFECRGSITFTQEQMPKKAPDAGFGISNELLNLLSHAGEHEILRDIAAMNLPHTGETQPHLPDPYTESEGAPAQEIGGRRLG